MGRIIYANTHAEFLNQCFGKNYKAFMKSRWPYDEETWVWMIKTDHQVRDGWMNNIVSENEVWEEYIGDEPPTFKTEKERKYRIVVSVQEGINGREYHILGKYQYSKEESKIGRNVLIKVCEF